MMWWLRRAYRPELAFVLLSLSCVEQPLGGEQGEGAGAGTSPSGGGGVAGPGSGGGGNAAAAPPANAGGSTNAAGTGAMPSSDATGGTIGAGGSSSGVGGSNSVGGATSSGGSTASGGSSGMCGSKRGVAYGFASASASADITALAAPLRGVSWYYGWAIAPSRDMGSAYAAAGVEFVPMVWGAPSDVDALAAAIPAGAKYLLGFNEPNFRSQSNMTPAQAAAQWPLVEEIARRRNLQLVSPAVNYCGPPSNCHHTDPFAWLDEFFAACQGCRVDHIAAHWYACGASADRPWLQDYINGMKKYGRPIWLTEFACADGGPWSSAEVDAYARQALAYLENEPMIFRYAWFSGRTNLIPNVNLLAGAGQLTALGNTYTSQPTADCP